MQHGPLGQSAGPSPEGKGAAESQLLKAVSMAVTSKRDSLDEGKKLQEDSHLW